MDCGTYPQLRLRAQARRVAFRAIGTALLIAASCAPAATAATQTFFYTGAEQSFKVPAGVTTVGIVAIGGSGGRAAGAGGGLGGKPAEVSGNLSVTPGETLYVEVGSNGLDASLEIGGFGGFNGGGNGADQAGGGGGASDVRIQPRPSGDSPFSLNSRLIVAAGGGGGGAGTGAFAGGDGGSAGSDGGSVNGATGGGAGSTTAGGIGCGGVCNGGLGVGGSGSVGLAGSGGGGGGAGYYGGGGGSSNATDTGGGGGGGSSLLPPGGSTIVPSTPPPAQVRISYTLPSPETPSNDFTVLTSVVAKNNSITLLLDAPSAGAFTAVANGKVVKHGAAATASRGRAQTIPYGVGTAAVKAPGGVALVIRPSKAAKKALKTVKRLPVSIAVTFTPTGGNPKTQTVRVNVTGSAKPKRHQ
jgi:Glycine rich protein